MLTREEGARITGAAFLRAVLVPIGILALAGRIFLQAGFQGSVGPLDLATADVVSLGLWVAAPVVGGLASRTLDIRQLIVAATVLGTVAALPAAAMIVFGATTGAACQGAVRSAVGFWASALAAIFAVGIGAGAAEFITARLARRGRGLLAVLLGAGLNFSAGAGAYFLIYSIAVCLLPS
jgi:hypothetical protein